jgi:hypothetical protein
LYSDIVPEQIDVVNSMVNQFIELNQDRDHDWVILGDHGSPEKGNPEYHEEESLIVSNLEPPKKTREVFDWQLAQFDVSDKVVQPEVGKIQSQLSPDGVEDTARRLI